MASDASQRRSEHPSLSDVNRPLFFTLMPLSSLAIRTVVYPAQLIKTRMQAAAEPGQEAYRTARHALKSIIQREGVRALYKGTLWSLSRACSLSCALFLRLLVAAFSFVDRRALLHARTRHAMCHTPEAHALIFCARALVLAAGYFSNILSMLNGPLYVFTLESTQTLLEQACRTQGIDERTARPVASMGSGAVASLVGQTVIVPLDIVSQHIMVSRKAPVRGLAGLALPFRMMGTILRQAGLRGLYRGYFISLATYVPASSLFWAGYAVAREQLARVSPYVAKPRRDLWPRSWFDAASVPLAGACAGMASGLMTTPLDVVRTRMQLREGESISAAKLVRQIVREEGAAAFLRGSSARVLQMGLTMTIIITAYETLKRVTLIDDRSS